MKFLNLSKKKKSGFTLVEILLVVGFIALAGIGIYTIYAKVQVSNQANTESRNLDTIRAGIKNLYGGNSNYGAPTAISPTVINNARITPESMRTPGNAAAITNTFGGAVVIAPVNLGAGANNGFSISYPAVPGAVCTKLVTTAGVQFDQVTVGGNVVKVFGTNQLDPAAAAAQCNADAGNGVLIVFESL